MFKKRIGLVLIILLVGIVVAGALVYLQPAEIREPVPPAEIGEPTAPVDPPVEVVERIPGLSSSGFFEKEEYDKAGQIYHREEDLKAYDQETGGFVTVKTVEARSLLFSLPAGTKVYSPKDGLVRGYAVGLHPITHKPINNVTIFIPHERKMFQFSGLRLTPALLQEYNKTKQPVEVKRGQLVGEVEDNNIREFWRSLEKIIFKKERDIPKDYFNLVLDILRGDIEAFYKAKDTGEFKEMIKVIEPDTTTLGQFFPYY